MRFAVIIKFKRGTEIAEREAALEDIKKSGKCWRWRWRRRR